jgi:hypothetical protein
MEYGGKVPSLAIKPVAADAVVASNHIRGHMINYDVFSIYASN